MLNLFNWVESLVKFCTFNLGDDDDGAPPVQQSTSYSTNLPEYAQPYYSELLKQTGKQVFSTDPAGNVTGVKSYQPYTGERIAGFQPEQIALQQQIAALTTPDQFKQAGAGLLASQTRGLGLANQGFNQALAYVPSGYTPSVVGAPGVSASVVSAPGVNASNVSANTFDASDAREYMSPYQQAVTDIALRETQKQADLQKQQSMLGAIGRNTFGGARQALMQSEQDRNLLQMMGDVQAKGSAAGYLNAQQQFNADAARQLQAAQANQAAQLQAGLANQSTGLQAGLANQSTGLQAAQATQAAQLQAALANQSARYQAAQLAQQGEQYAAGLGKDIGLAGLGTATDTSKALGALGATEQQANLERLKSQSASAEEKQALQQQINDLKYQQYQETQNYQRNLLDYYSNILRGNAGALGSTQVQYTAAPSTAQQIASLGLSGLSLYKALS